MILFFFVSYAFGAFTSKCAFTHCSVNSYNAETTSISSKNTLGIVIMSSDWVFHSSWMKLLQDLCPDAAMRGRESERERVLALLFLALENTCSSSQIKPELIRIIGMYYMNSVLCWIFPSTPCWKRVLSFCTLEIRVKLCVHPAQMSFFSPFFLSQSSTSSCFFPSLFPPRMDH